MICKLCGRTVPELFNGNCFKCKEETASAVLEIELIDKEEGPSESVVGFGGSSCFDIYD